MLLAACTTLTGDFSDVIAIQYTGPSAPRPEEGDTVRLSGIALGLDGQPLPSVTVVWRSLSLNPDSVGFTLDSLNGLITALFPGGPWPVQGRVEQLRTEPIQVSVTAAPDSVGVEAPGLDTVAVAEPESAPLSALVYDLTTSPGQALPLSGKRVVFRLAEPAPGTPLAAGVALAIPGEVPGADPHTVDRLSGTGGRATVTAERVAGLAQPDSIIIEATAYTARGLAVPGSPARLLVFFSLN